jgi:PKD repeat protein
MLHRRPLAVALPGALALLLATCSEPTEPDQNLTPSFDVVASVVVFAAGDISGCSTTGDEQTATLLDGLLAANPAAKAFAIGDNVYEDGTAAEFQNCYDPSWGRFKAKTYPVLGNHEYNTGTANAYFDYFNGVGADSGVAGKRGKGYYSYDAGAWHIVVLNANTSYVGTKAGTIQETWLRNDLAATAQPCILALWHQSRFYSVSDTVLPVPTGYVLDFWKDLYAAGADLILNAHHHYYERYAPMDPNGGADPVNGIRQIIVGTGGKSVSTPSLRQPNSQVLNGNTYGVIKLTLGDGTYSWQFIPVAGKSFTDNGSGNCHGAGAPSNTPPVAAFTNSCTNLSCSFTDGSTDADGTVASRSWNFGDNATSTATNPSHTYAAGGTYTVSLTVTDDKGATGSTSKQITVSAANVSPTAAFTNSCTNLACTFTDGSSDPDGTIASRSWNFGDNATSTATNPSHTYASGGSYTVTLTVTDDKGAPGSTSKQVTVTAPPNSAPTAAFTSRCVGLTCNFTDGSTDTDGTVVGWTWNFGDNSPTSTTKNPSHSYTSAGQYTVTLTVRDDKGATGTISKPVTANPIGLTAKGRKVKGVEFVDLTWSGATTSSVNVYRNGAIVIQGTPNDGAQTDALNRKGAGTFTYKVCEAGSTTVCSNQATVTF